MCSPWPLPPLLFNSDAKLQRQQQHSDCFTVHCRERKAPTPRVWDMGCKSLWVSSSKASVERCFCRILSPHALLGVFAYLERAPHPQLTTGRNSSQSCQNEGRILLSPRSPSYLHPMDLKCSMLPPMFWKRRAQTTSSGLSGSQIRFRLIFFYLHLF